MLDHRTQGGFVMSENENEQKTGDNEAMLQEIVQNTEMGKNTLDEMMSLTRAKGQSAAARMSVSMGIRTRTMLDKSTRTLATMLAEGSGQGVLDCKRAETDYPQASPGAHKLMEELCSFQTAAEQTWREFV